MENKVKIDAAVLRGNRMELSNIGGTLGGRFFRLNKHAIDDEYGNLIAQIRNTGNKELCLNRGINRYAIQGFDIHRIEFKNAGDGTPCVFINEGDKNSRGEDMSAVCPVGNRNRPFTEASEESIGEAIESQRRDLIFADPDGVVDIVNRYNQNEMARIDSLIQQLTKAKNNIVQTIENNNKRAMEYKKELRDSSKTVTSVSIVGSINVE